jgi:hypothetical protein
VRLLNAGVYYNRRDSGSGVGMGQLLLGLGVLVLAGLVLGGGAIVLLGNRPSATPTHVAVVPTPTAGATLATPTASVAPTQTLFFTPPPSPTLVATGSPTVAPTITPQPTPLPTATPVPTPAPTPVACASASQGTNVKQLQLGRGHDFHKGPLPKTWCIRNVTIGSWAGWGTARLKIVNKVIFEATCLPPGPCSDSSKAFVPPYQANRGKTLQYYFQCFDDPATSVNECADSSLVGTVITIDYEAFAGP